MRARFAILLLGLTLVTSPAWAQETTWTVEFYGGRHVGSGSTGGSPGPDFTPRETFTTASGFPSRVVPSWYFGDGTRLFNQVSDDFASRFGQIYDQITPLDGVLRSAAARGEGGAGFGVRVTRRLSPRVAVEFGFGRSARPLRLTSEAEAAIEVTRASFERAFTGLFTTVPQTASGVTSEVTVTEPDTHASMMSGAVVISLAARDRWRVHGIAGAGWRSGSEESLEVRLTGNYHFTALGVFPFNETDTVTVRVSTGGGRLVGVFGGRITYDFGARHGLHVDLRVEASGNDSRTEVSASPDDGFTTVIAVLPSNTSPSLQFSTDPTVRSSLGGGPLEQTTFRGSGIDLLAQVTVGYVFRF